MLQTNWESPLFQKAWGPPLLETQGRCRTIGGGSIAVRTARVAWVEREGVLFFFFVGGSLWWEKVLKKHILEKPLV